MIEHGFFVSTKLPNILSFAIFTLAIIFYFYDYVEKPLAIAKQWYKLSKYCGVFFHCEQHTPSLDLSNKSVIL